MKELNFRRGDLERIGEVFGVCIVRVKRCKRVFMYFVREGAC